MTNQIRMTSAARAVILSCVVHRIKWLILYTACITMIALSSLLVLQKAGKLRPWAFYREDQDRAFRFQVSVWKSISFFVSKESLPAGEPFSFQTQISIDSGGIYYLQLRNYAEGQISLSWPLAISAILTFLCIRHFLRHRRHINPHACPHCGYDLRATPDRCPECGKTATE